MNQTIDRAPMTRIQRHAAVSLPAFLLLGLTVALSASPGDAGGWLIRIVIVAGAAAMVLGIVWASATGECPDERERIVQGRAYRNAFVILFVAIAIIQTAHSPDADWNAPKLMLAAAFLAMAIYSGSVLLYLRRGM